MQSRSMGGPRVPVPEDMAEKIRELFGLLGNKSAVAREVGLDRGTVSRYCGPSSPFVLRPAEETRGSPLVEPVTVVAPPAWTPPGPQTVHLDGHKRIAMLFDIHHPFHDQRALDSVFEQIKDWEPDLLMFCGDTLDCHSISRFDKDPARAHLLQEEIDSVGPTISKADRLSCRKILLDGNHEARLAALIAENPGLYGLRALQIPELLGLPKSWGYFPDQTHFRAGNLLIHHGNPKGRGCGGMYPAAAMLRKLRTTSIFGHLHRMELKCQTEYDGSVTSSYACGHLADPKKIDYIANPDWQQGYALATIDRSGVAHVQQKFIVDGRVHHDGCDY